ncbi:hypothetical protein P4S72_22215 [Vibrio sp. PP-XX7]
MGPNYKQAQALTAKLKERIPPDAFVSHHTIGMHPMETGFNYAELSTQDHARSQREAIVIPGLLSCMTLSTIQAEHHAMTR